MDRIKEFISQTNEEEVKRREEDRAFDHMIEQEVYKRSHTVWNYLVSYRTKEERALFEQEFIEWVERKVKEGHPLHYLLLKTSCKREYRVERRHRE